jgi:pantoate--beta-alanine ligase
LSAFNALKMGESHVFTSVESLQTRLNNAPENSTIGFLPTMGALHHGHIALVSQALRETDVVVVSIFVNPTQFNKSEDLDNYPRNLAYDLSLLNTVGEIVVFAPSVEEVYPKNFEDLDIDLKELGTSMEGEFRPGHFQGVMNVVKRLFDIVKPTKAYFGLKDLQQVAVIRFMTDSLQLPVEIVPCEIIREPSGLASSSRNERLTEDQKEEALVLINTLRFAKSLVGEYSPKETRKRAIAFFEKSDLLLEYFDIVHPLTLAKLEDEWVSGATACTAGYCGEVRILDNLELIPNE